MRSRSTRPFTLPDRPGFACGADLGIDELRDAAIVREVHVYGPSLELGRSSTQHAQHQGLGTRLLQAAEEIGRARGSPSDAGNPDLEPAAA